MNNFAMNDGSNEPKNIVAVKDFDSVSRTFVTKMAFINNALENGWSIKKNNESYIFSKKHEGKKEMFSDSYLSTFVKENSIMQSSILN